MVTLHLMISDCLELVSASRHTAKRVWRDGLPMNIFSVFPSKLALLSILNREPFSKRLNRSATLDFVGGSGFPTAVPNRETRPTDSIPGHLCGGQSRERLLGQLSDLRSQIV